MIVKEWFDRIRGEFHDVLLSPVGFHCVVAASMATMDRCAPYTSVNLEGVPVEINSRDTYRIPESHFAGMPFFETSGQVTTRGGDTTHSVKCIAPCRIDA